MSETTRTLNYYTMPAGSPAGKDMWVRDGGQPQTGGLPSRSALDGSVQVLCSDAEYTKLVPTVGASVMKAKTRAQKPTALLPPPSLHPTTPNPLSELPPIYATHLAMATSPYGIFPTLIAHVDVDIPRHGISEEDKHKTTEYFQRLLTLQHTNATRAFNEDVHTDKEYLHRPPSSIPSVVTPWIKAYGGHVDVSLDRVEIHFGFNRATIHRDEWVFVIAALYVFALAGHPAHWGFWNEVVIEKTARRCIRVLGVYPNLRPPMIPAHPTVESLVHAVLVMHTGRCSAPAGMVLQTNIPSVPTVAPAPPFASILKRSPSPGAVTMTPQLQKRRKLTEGGAFERAVATRKSTRTIKPSRIAQQVAAASARAIVLKRRTVGPKAHVTASSRVENTEGESSSTSSSSSSSSTTTTPTTTTTSGAAPAAVKPVLSLLDLGAPIYELSPMGVPDAEWSASGLSSPSSAGPSTPGDSLEVHLQRAELFEGTLEDLFAICNTEPDLQRAELFEGTLEDLFAVCNTRPTPSTASGATPTARTPSLSPLDLGTSIYELSPMSVPDAEWSTGSGMSSPSSAGPSTPNDFQEADLQRAELFEGTLEDLIALCNTETQL
ncbi:uncharacterized protein BXZ73DRAFT_105447 [Epithele typhae]|uniref:uncharacterized protein n=1 Tax=Epithele typhae TaxID=378194 RepID=UPI002008CC21|nr:uncharacterized protein BXZ73DRAFT_105447 [Epithele typhae]KAH9917927.1 hypothetical protein BXZ73DRAFT_105447 [Epithele typhae]